MGLFVLHKRNNDNEYRECTAMISYLCVSIFVCVCKFMLV